MTVQRVNIASIRTNPNNPRIIKDDKFNKLVASIKQFPEMLELRPIVVDKEYVVLGGNMRLKACQAAGLKEIPVVVADQLTADQQREFIIKDNVGFGEWDWDALGNAWDVDELSRWGMDLPTFPDESEQDAPAELDGTSFQVIVICKSDIEQGNIASELEQRGFECRLLTL